MAAPHLIPPSYKGWIWCEDVHENADPVGGNMGYCMGAHYGNQKNNLAGSFEEWGDAEALKNHNIKTWELGGFTYKQDPLKYYKPRQVMYMKVVPTRWVSSRHSRQQAPIAP